MTRESQRRVDLGVELKVLGSGMDGSYEPSISDIGLVSQSSINESDCNEMQYKGVRYDKLSTEDLKGQEFKIIEEAKSFYNAYAKAIGFEVRSDYKRLSIRIIGRVTSLQLVCSAQGKRREEYMSNKKRVHKPKKETRFNCPCLFKVREGSIEPATSSTEYFNKEKTD
ncbi:protein FAR1-RELATED SEQUENCE 5-like [Rosa chinensis]|uniref:protein FAR1-RELATED SEQUENCE 5-like n=1 Tax=Rosa chinensis TaxID=74649 RepID=UPI000D08AB75|nr:protein FAR1-RELATED SEQUENCE 5-like [Rosa chinensis]